MIDLTVQDRSTTLGDVLVTFTELTPPTEWIGYRIYHQADESPDAEWTLVHETRTLQTTYQIPIYTYSNANVQRFSVVTITSESSTGRLLEDGFGTQVALTVLGVDRDYWLVHPEQPELSILLETVTDDNLEREHEIEVTTLIGRGRKVNLGEELGLTGSLSVVFRDSDLGTARRKRQDLQSLVSRGDRLFLRDPFGDVVPISIEKMSYKHIAGTGSHEATDVSLQIVEVV